MLKRVGSFGVSGLTIQQSLSHSKTFLVAAPSGTGKGTVIKEMVRLRPELFYLAISVTTRPPRAGEVDGVHYHFVNLDQFRMLEEADEFVETAEYSKNWYGTLKSEIVKAELDGKIIIGEIEAKGVAKMREHYPGKVEGVVLYPPNQAELLRRLVLRKTDTDEQIVERVGKAADEIFRLLALGLHPVCNRTGEATIAAEEVIAYAEKVFAD
jgi:guanylate kinase